MNQYIGIDLGTSAVKLLLVNEDGVIAGEQSRGYDVVYPREGWSEQSPADWWDAVADGMRALLAGTDAKRVKGLAVAGQMHGLVTLDADDNVIRPAILWNDGRTQRQTDRLNTEIGKAQLSAWTANIAFAGFTAPKLLWMRENEPENFERIAKIMLPKDYIVYKLTGEHATDCSDASGTLFFDVKNRRWSREMTDVCRIRESQLPRVCESEAPVGTLLPEIAARFGLSPDTVVAAGAGDNAAAAVGTGTVTDGACNISLGTSGTVFIASDTFTVDPANALHSFDHAGGKYHLMGCILSAASCNKWFCEDILGRTDFGAVQAEIDAERLGRNSVMFLPYLMGERSPVNDADARGAFVGLSAGASRADLMQAVLEGVAFALRDCLEVAWTQGVDVRRSTVCGGGAKSDLWLRILADVTGLTLVKPVTEQGPGYGAAMLAMTATGAYANVADCAAAIVRTGEVIAPDPAVKALYDEKFGIYKRIYPALKMLEKK